MEDGAQQVEGCEQRGTGGRARNGGRSRGSGRGGANRSSACAQRGRRSHRVGTASLRLPARVFHPRRPGPRIARTARSHHLFGVVLAQVPGRLPAAGGGAWCEPPCSRQGAMAVLQGGRPLTLRDPERSALRGRSEVEDLRRPYLIWSYTLNIGRYIAITMKPTIEPTITIITGSRIDVSAFTAASTCSS